MKLFLGKGKYNINPPASFSVARSLAGKRFKKHISAHLPTKSTRVRRNDGKLKNDCR
ncbi:MAG TPA: hypothetical protein VF610_10660 [Segetibacter sp.]